MDYTHQLHARASVSGDCTKDTCPASLSVYGYAPSWVANLFFVVVFALSAIVFYHQALFWPRWRAFSIVCVVGCAMEVAGYIGRLLLHHDPFSDFGFKLNVVFLTIAPAFISAAIYLTLKRATLIFGKSLSRVPPVWYLYIFVTCDVVSMLLQGAGGAISAMASKQKLLDAGVNVMIAGLASQVFSLLAFLACVVDYYIRCHQQPRRLNPGTIELASSIKFKLFAAAMMTSFVLIFTRCCYRVAELSGGWGNHIMRKETEFIALDSVMIAIATFLLNIFHPNIFFRAPKPEEDLPHGPIEDFGCGCRAEQSGQAVIAIQHMKARIMTAFAEVERDTSIYSKGGACVNEKNWI